MARTKTTWICELKGEPQPWTLLSEDGSTASIVLNLAVVHAPETKQASGRPIVLRVALCEVDDLIVRMVEAKRCAQAAIHGPAGARALRLVKEVVGEGVTPA